tara:strand:- start:411 stop:773 length:363 start_codon:yes stop_codon:yes gene_type:complete
MNLRMMLKKTIFALSLALLTKIAWATGSGNACVVKSASTLRLSGLVEEYNLYAKSIEQTSAQVSKFLANPRNFENGPIDFDTARTSRASTELLKTPSARDLAREVSVYSENRKATGKGSL